MAANVNEVSIIGYGHSRSHSKHLDIRCDVVRPESDRARKVIYLAQLVDIRNSVIYSYPSGPSKHFHKQMSQYVSINKNSFKIFILEMGNNGTLLRQK